MNQAAYLSPKRLSEMKEIFGMFESEKKDLMKISDLGFAIKCLGIRMSEEEEAVLIRAEGKVRLG